MKKERKITISNDFECHDFNHGEVERYDFTRSKLIPEDYGTYNPKEDGDFKEWCENNLEYDELYEIPMMNTLWYYPSFITFSEEDRKKTSGTITLLYDNDREQWAVGMTGGGMDLLPHLVDTFINLENCIPEELAIGMSRNYNAYVDEKKHLENCEIIANALEKEGNNFIDRANRLRDKN